MNLILSGILVYLAAGIITIVVPGNATRAKIGVLSQFVGALLILIPVIPVLWGAPDLAGEIQWSYPIGVIGLIVDPLDAFFLCFSLIMTAFGTLYAYGYMRPYFLKRRHVGIHFMLLNLTSISFVMIYTLQNAMAFFFGWELAAIAAWLLVIWDHGNQKVRFAGFNYLVSTHFSLIFLIAGFMVIYAHTGSFDFKSFPDFLHVNSFIRNIAFVLLIVAFGLKSAFFPFHTWLPRAHSAAPAHVSALMSGVIHKAGLYGILRLTMLLGTPDEWMGWFIIAFSLLSGFFGVLYTIAQRDLKRLLGYSSTENVGLAGVGFGLGYLGIAWQRPELVCLGFAGGILHIVNHAFFKCLLFYSAGAIYRMAHTIDIEKMGGLIKSMPITAAFFLCGSIAIAGLPPLNGFVSEFLIYSGLFHGAGDGSLKTAALILVAAMVAFIGAISALSMIRAFGVAFLGYPRDPKAHYEGDPSIPMIATMAFHVFGMVLLGVFPFAALELIQLPVARIMGTSALPMIDRLGTVREQLASISKISLLLFGMTIAVAALRSLIIGRGSTRRSQVTWGCGYGAVNSRMQYTAASFSSPMVTIFKRLLRFKSNIQLPEGLFPSKSHFNTHCIDSTEVRIFKVLGEGESSMARLLAHLREEFNASFAFGLVFLAVVFSLLIVGVGFIR